MPPKRATKKPSPKKAVKKTKKSAATPAAAKDLGAHIHPYGTARHADSVWQRERFKKHTGGFAEQDQKTLHDALVFAEERHKSQLRKGGGPYILHPIRIANILMDEWRVTDKPHVIAAALLHDTVEDTQTTLKEIKDAFGDDVGKLVDGMTMWKGSETFETYCARVRRGPEMLRVIKCADAMDNLRSWHELDDPAKCAQWWRQAHDHVLPIARSVSDDIATIFNNMLDDTWYLKKAGLN